MENKMNEYKRKPTTPGEILHKEYMLPLQLTQKELADHLGVDIKVINRLINGKTSVSAEMALKLAHTFTTTPDFWLNAQNAVDFYNASRNLKKLPSPIVRKKAA
jgi:antitoxin HigA-1